MEKTQHTVLSSSIIFFIPCNANFHISFDGALYNILPDALLNIIIFSRALSHCVTVATAGQQARGYQTRL